MFFFLPMGAVMGIRLLGPAKDELVVRLVWFFFRGGYGGGVWLLFRGERKHGLF